MKSYKYDLFSSKLFVKNSTRFVPVVYNTYSYENNNSSSFLYATEQLSMYQTLIEPAVTRRVD